MWLWITLTHWSYSILMFSVFLRIGWCDNCGGLLSSLVQAVWCFSIQQEETLQKIKAAAHQCFLWLNGVTLRSDFTEWLMQGLRWSFHLLFSKQPDAFQQSKRSKKTLSFPLHCSVTSWSCLLDYFLWFERRNKTSFCIQHSSMSLSFCRQHIVVSLSHQLTEPVFQCNFQTSYKLALTLPFC